MKAVRILVAALLLVLSLQENLWASPGVLELMKNMEEMQELSTDVTVKLKFTQKIPDQGVRVSEAVYYQRNRDDSFLVVMVEPNHEKGNGYLRVDNNMWMYRRNTRTFQIMHRGQTISGTNVTAGDMEKKKFTDLYEPALDENGKEIFSEETLGKAKIPVYRFEVRGKVKDVEYPKVVYWVRQDNFLVLKDESYSLSGTLMETTYYPKYTKIDGKYLTVKAIIIDEFEKGNKTVVELSGISLKKINDDIFTKAYLENLSK